METISYLMDMAIRYAYLPLSFLMIFLASQFLSQARYILSANSLQDLRDNGYAETEGTVVGTIKASRSTEDDDGSFSYEAGKLLLIEFSTLDENTYRVRAKDMHTGYRTGDRVLVLYPPNNPAGYILQLSPPPTPEDTRKAVLWAVFYAFSLALTFWLICSI
jgi:hypothetical protein